ncbi:D-alanyl-D-alanine carboxypeptidase family protein [Aquibacillus sediminis]|uniref:D-alanyl-D-alanine carboxypeptidase family protein n=1 Tax=Aquibacillus sediminis TaxID=2574734 RepID=UPI00319E201E
MKHILIIISCACMLFVTLPVQTFAKPGVSAENAVLIEQSSGRVLYEKNADEQHLIASITKIMTAILAIESGKLDEEVTVSERAVYTEGSSLYLKQGEKIKLEDLVYGLMLRSGNDAAVAIAEHVGGSVEGFAHLMNQTAAWIGMTNSHFDNPHGLDSETHYSTAYDMGMLMRYAMENEVFKEIASTKSYQQKTKNVTWLNKNKLLTRYYEYCTGGKTGFTRAAGRTLVSTAEKDGMELIAVTLNAPDDWNDHISLFEWAFDNYDLKTIQEKGKQTFQITGDDPSIQTGYIQEDIKYPLTKEEQAQVESSTYFEYPEIREPDEMIGKKFYKLNDRAIAEAPIYSDTNNEEVSFINQITHWFNRLLGVL